MTNKEWGYTGYEPTKPEVSAKNTSKVKRIDPKNYKKLDKFKCQICPHIRLGFGSFCKLKGWNIDAMHECPLEEKND